MMREKKSVEGGGGGLNRGPWQPHEDLLLKTYLQVNGVGRWSTLPTKAGLNRCTKSCRLRWINHLRPNLKRGRISPDEEELIIRLHKLLGNRWSLIAARVPGRTDNDVKNFWNLHLRKKSLQLKAKDTPSSSAAMGTEINSSSTVDQNLESYKNLNVSIGSTSDPAESKQLEQQPRNLNNLQLHQNSHAICSTEIMPDSDSFWFGCLPWLVSANDADNFYCNYSTIYFADVQQPNNQWL